jgi:putative oxidoreductase
MQRFVSALAGQSSVGYFLLRLLTGIILALSGYNKFFNIGIGAITSNFEKWGIPLAQISAPFIALLELVGGIMLLLGLFTRYVAVLFAIEFVVATWTKWSPMAAGWAGSRLEFMILFAAVLYATNGAGAYSVDSKIGQP